MADARLCITGDGDAAEPDALAAAVDGGDAAKAADASDSEAIELDLDDYELTDRGLDQVRRRCQGQRHELLPCSISGPSDEVALRLQALKFRGGVPDRRGRKPTRAEKGSYIDDGDLQREVPVL